MYLQHFKEYLSRSFELQANEEVTGEVKTGVLTQKAGQHGEYKIRNFIPRFSDDSSYADSFGFQWNIFKATQLDSYTGLTLSRDRFYTFTKWSPAELNGKKILEVGCGAGRFTEIMLKAGARLVSVDYSGAVEANYKNNKNERLFIGQADLFHLPFEKESFDYVFCYGVLQHTPDPLGAFKAISEFLKPGGKISIDNYIRRLFSPYSSPKYFWRPLTKRMNPDLLLKIIKFYIPIYLPFDTFIRKIPKMGPRLLALIPIPCWNYINSGLTYQQRKEWAILDTFDALSATYDIPLEIDDFEKACKTLPFSKFEVFYGSNGLVVNATAKL